MNSLMKVIAMQNLPLTDDRLEPRAVHLRSHAGERIADPATEADDVSGKPVSSVTSHDPAVVDIVITHLQRHPHTSQSIIALDFGRWLLIEHTRVDGDPDLDAAKAMPAPSAQSNPAAMSGISPSPPSILPPMWPGSSVMLTP